jgi:signal transduction histidine kinase
LLAAVYAVTAKLSLALDAVSGFATLVWPPSGIALAALLWTRSRLWPGVLLGAFLANTWVGAPPLVAFAIALGNTAEAWIGVRLLEGRGLRHSLDRLPDVVALLVGAALISTSVSAAIGTLSLRTAGIVPADRVLPTLRAWWTGDALGDLVVAPILLVWSERATRLRLGAARVAEATLLALLLALTARTVLFEKGLGSVTEGAARQSYLLFPLLIWAALRFGLRGATLAVNGVSAMAVAATVLQRGPFASGGQLAQRLLALQAFTAVVAVTVLLLAAALAERTRALQLRDRFLAIVSHDLQNPLTAVRLRAESISRRAGENATIPVARGDLDVIVRATERMDRLARDLSDVSAIEAEKLSVHPEVEDMVAIALEASESFRASLPGRLELRMIAHTAPVRVMCDRERVLQVLSNLLTNAVKFTRTPGTITVEVEPLADMARVRVTDTGVGMAAHEVSRVFEPYWQAEGTRERSGGMGLGLFIARHIVEAHHGRIWAQSRPERGTAFFFTLPRAPAAPEVEGLAAGQSARAPAPGA